MTGQNMKRLGDYIRPVDVRNRDLKVTRLMGINIEKRFMPSVANVVGTDLSNYKVVSKGQFACNLMHVGRDEKIPVALQKDDEPIIVSPAYVVFEVVDTNVLLTEYLMMWFSRSEFDRNAWFYTDGDVRGGMDRDALFDMQIPVPAIEKQREIVAEYNTLATRIETNKKLIATLEQTAQTLYRHTFVDNIDPNNLPSGWRMGTLGEVCSVITKGTTPSTEGASFSDSGVNFIKCESITEDHTINKKMLSFIDVETHQLLSRSVIRENDIVFTIAGTLGKFAWIDYSILPANTNQAIAIIRADETKISPYYLMGVFMGGLHIDYCKRNVQQAVQANLSLGVLSAMPIILAGEKESKEFAETSKILLNKIVLKQKEDQTLTQMQTLLLSKMGV